MTINLLSILNFERDSVLTDRNNKIDFGLGASFRKPRQVEAGNRA